MTKNLMFSLAEELLSLRDQKDLIESQLQEINKQIESTNDRLAEIMIAQDCHRFNHQGVTYYSAVEMRPRIIDESSFFDWLKKHDYEGIMKNTVHPSTLRSWYKEDGVKYEQELKGTMLDVSEQVRVRIRRNDRKA